MRGEEETRRGLKEKKEENKVRRKMKKGMR